MKKHYEAYIEYSVEDGSMEHPAELTAYRYNRTDPPDARDIRRVIAQQEPGGIEGDFSCTIAEVRKPWYRL